MRPIVLSLLLANAAFADETWPKVGGHFGLALSLLDISNDANAFIGRDYVQVGVTPGITIKLDPHWSIDFEFIANTRWDFNATLKSHTIFVVDPGVIYGWTHVAVGLRLAVQVGEGVPMNFGLVPIVVVPFQISKLLKYFLELDLPVFLTIKSAANGDARAVGSVGLLFQTGFAF